ncbi:hypothetical protein ACODM8_06040 [Vibrio ostreicida]|uniref:hypothetical protein n=1 Tax=Vibrio ostreicida TaxID=526588 RepID=UPI003B59E503
MKYISLVIVWVCGGFFLLIGLMSMIKSPLVGLPLIVISGLLLPPIRKLTYSKTNIELSPKLRGISIFVLFVAFLVLVGQQTKREEQQLVEQEIKAEAERVAQIEKANIDYYNENRKQIIESAQSAFDMKNYKLVVDENSKYLVAGDAQLQDILEEAELKVKEQQVIEKTASILAKLKQIPVSEFEKNKESYQELVALHPDNEQYQEKVSFYEEKIKIAEQEKLVAQKRKEQIEQQFSAWDGSHRNLERMIKKAMNDPDSYEHDETVYWDKGSYLIVKTVYRGKNAFGGIVRNFVKVKVSLDGQILQVLDQS